MELPVSDLEMDALYEAWTIIANAYEGDWSRAQDEWRQAAERWRDEKFHLLLDAQRSAGEWWAREHPERAVRLATHDHDAVWRALEGEWGVLGTIKEMLAPLTAEQRSGVLKAAADV